MTRNCGNQNPNPAIITKIAYNKIQREHMLNKRAALSEKVALINTEQAKFNLDIPGSCLMIKSFQARPEKPV